MAAEAGIQKLASTNSLGGADPGSLDGNSGESQSLSSRLRVPASSPTSCSGVQSIYSRCAHPGLEEIAMASYTSVCQDGLLGK